MATVRITEGGPKNADNFEFSWGNGAFQAHLLSDVGKKRTRNEDSCILCAPQDRRLAQEYGMLFAVADGMGGVSGGDLASRLALEMLAEQYFVSAETASPARLHDAIQRANRVIFEEAENRPEFYGMGTTVSVLAIHGGNAYLAQVGDSRVYLARDSENLWQITDDHSLVAEQLRSGMISEDEARNHSLKNLITRAVGTKEAVKVDLFALPLKQNDTILICSDGLSNVVSDTQIAAAMRLENLQGAARSLVGRALEGGGSDNITVALVRVKGTPEKTRLHPGATRVALSKPGIMGKLLKLFT